MINFHIGGIEEVQRLIKYHYSNRIPSNIQYVGCHYSDGGLFGNKGVLLACCIFSIPPTRWKEDVLELSRLIRIDNISINLTELISKTVKYIKNDKKYDLLVSYADNSFNHHGGIYQAASWNYHGLRGSRMDGIIIDSKFIPGRSANSIYGTQSTIKLSNLLHKKVEPHYDKGKYLYWKSLNRKGEYKAKALGLLKMPYPKPARAEIEIEEIKEKK